MLNTILGFDIGGTKTAVVEGTPNGDILQRVEMPTRAEQPFDETFPAIAEAGNRIVDKAAASGRKVVATSASIGGPLHIMSGVLIDPPHLPGWHHVRIGDRLSECFPGLPAHVEHDGNAGALAEFHFGAGKNRADLRHLIFLTFGTGLGGGLIVNGQVVHGASDTAGEVGHWGLKPDGPVGFGKAGSWEGLASGQAIAETAHSMFPERWPEDVSIRDVVGAILDDDADALQVCAEIAHWLGHGMSLLVDVLNPQMIVLGSLGVVLGDRVLAPARDVVARESLPQAAAACEIVPAALGSGIGDVASLMAALIRMKLV